MHTIVIKVWRGIVSEVYSDNPNTEIVILDEDRRLRAAFLVVQCRRTWPRVGLLDQARLPGWASRPGGTWRQRGRDRAREKAPGALPDALGSTAAYLSMMFAAIWMFPASSVLRRIATAPSPAR